MRARFLLQARATIAPADDGQELVMDINTFVGGFAAICTTVANLPQLKKCWATGSAEDLSLKTYSILAIGVASWIFYGYLQSDTVIVLANAASLMLILGILYSIVRERFKRPATWL